jgi:hypothetical protein
MSRKSGDKNFQTYVGYQAFSCDEPTHRINDTKLYLKYEKQIPAFFINAENVFRQITPECFLITAERSTTMNMSDWQKQCENYFGLTMDKIKCLTIKEEVKKQQKI